MAKVKVILQADIAGLGEEGDVKEVAGGYARNYLLPRKLVAPATKGNMRVLEQQRSQIETKQEQYRVEARALADRLATMPLDFPVRVGEQGRLYGSITGQDIAERLKGQGVEIDRRTIELREPLRALGAYDVPVRVAHAVTGHIRVTLRDQNAPVAVAAEHAAPVAAEHAAPVAAEHAAPPAESGPEQLGEDAVPVGAASVDTVVPASEIAPEPFQNSGQGAGAEAAVGETDAEIPGSDV